MMLRCLVLDALDEVMYDGRYHDGTRDIDNNSALVLAIERTSCQHKVTLPNIVDPNNNDNKMENPYPMHLQMDHPRPSTLIPIPNLMMRKI
jgi:hypothetical protein